MAHPQKDTAVTLEEVSAMNRDDAQLLANWKQSQAQVA